jgi:cytosine/uracil/thiamine/allantoin permease
MTDESFIRWRDTTRTHLGHTNNLVIGLSVGLLAYCGTLLGQSDFKPIGISRSLFLWTMGVLLSCAILGIACTVNRLLDFRLTAETVKKRDRENATDADLQPLRAKTRRYGFATWAFLWLQLASFAGGVILFVVAFISIYGNKLF